MKKLTAAVASALVLTSAAHAAGLGKLTVLSALGQPLRAEIELTSVSPEEASGLVAKLASPEAFRSANIELNPALLSLRFAVEQRGGRQFIRVSSTQPLNEPFVDMLLELTWNNGRLVREYTFLLDPAELRATQPAQVAANETARPLAETAPAPAAAAAPATERPSRPARGSAPAPARDNGQAAEYRVKRGDTLGGIAGELKPADVSLDMMLVALYRANPDAFIGNNMNRLKSGRILAVPEADAVRATSPSEARGVVVAHAADFNAYRNKLAGQVGASEAVKAPPASQSAGGRVTAKVEERPTAVNESQDKLRLSKAGTDAPAGKDAAGSTGGTEDRIAKEKALADAQKRVQELERNVGDLEKLATVKSKPGAEAEQNAAKPAQSPDAVLAKTEPAAAPKKLAPIKPAAKPAAPAEPGVFDFIMDNLSLVGGGAAALLLAGLLVAQRRKKKDDKAKAVSDTSVLGMPPEPSHSLFAESGGQSVDTNNSVFNSSFAPSASQLDTNEVDPVAEADVYIAYGRDAQAEEILKEALRTHPERMPVRLKLLEIYAARKDTRAFEAQASELYGMTRGHGDDWAQAAALGLSIDPLNPLYANGAAAAGAGVAAGASGEELGQQALLAKALDDAYGTPAADEPPARAPMSFDEHFADAMATAQPAPEPVTNAPASEHASQQAVDDNALDFDLGGMSFEPATPPAPEHKIDPNDLDFDMSDFAPAAPAQAAGSAESAADTAAEREAEKHPADDPLDFAFDMDFDAPRGEGQAAEPPTATPAARSDIDMADLAREFDLPELPGEARPPAPEQAAAKEQDDPLFDLDTMNFGLEEMPAKAQAAPHVDTEVDTAADTSLDTPLAFDRAEAPAPTLASNPSPALDDPLFDLSHLPGEHPESLPTATPAPATAFYAESDKIAPSVDLSTLDLDLPADGTLPLPEVHSLSGGEGGDGALSAMHMEMETKLDLAIAYQEIGDKEGARELLEEVIRGGSDEQVNRANTLRASLG
ncbi:FimV/HubP family polar landmark protein [Massilia sp. TN1-12]|uniref:FimV/HubP family polar landmark protein n=1 Tax=Massilia paldalensis TaxID=3377675 RepID=UPI00384E6FFB